MPAVSRLSALAPLVLLLACDFDLGEPDRYQRLTLSAAELTSLRIDAGAGDLTIAADPEAVDFTIVAGIHGDHTTISHETVGATLELTHACHSWHDCGLDWRVTVPAHLAAHLDTGAGDITGQRLQVPKFHGETGFGDLALELSARPRSVWWSSGHGDVDVTRNR